VQLHDLLEDYLADIEQTVELLPAYVERYQEEILTSTRANLRLRLRFVSGHLLEINEALGVMQDQLIWFGYRYHFQDQNNCLVFRYDDTPHFPNLSTFPHHKHWIDEVLESFKPILTEVLYEALRLSESVG
jgi:hypothetical protein